jgi:fluoride exporter
MTYVLLIIGGVAGALSRYHTTRLIQRRFAPSFPLATALINIAGSFLLGWLYGALGAEPSAWGHATLLLFGTGFCGAFTTFSTFAFETLSLWRAGHATAAITNVFTQSAAGLLAALLGAWLGA